MLQQLQQALQKIQAEIAAESKNKYVQYVGSYLISHVRNHPEDAGKIVTEGKTIAGSLQVMESEAKKQKTGNVAMLTPEEGFAIVLRYFGVHVPEANPAPAASAASFNVSLDDLL